MKSRFAAPLVVLTATALLSACSLIPEKKIDDATLAYDNTKSRAMNLLMPYNDEYDGTISDNSIGYGVARATVEFAKDIGVLSIAVADIGVSIMTLNFPGAIYGTLGKALRSVGPDSRLKAYSTPVSFYYTIFGYVDAKQATDYNDAVRKFAENFAASVANGITKNSKNTKATYSCNHSASDSTVHIEIIAPEYGCSDKNDDETVRCWIAYKFDQFEEEDLEKYNEVRLTNTPPVFGDPIPAYRMPLTGFITSVDGKFDWGQFLALAKDSLPKYSAVYAPPYRKWVPKEYEKDKPLPKPYYGKFEDRRHMVIERGAINYFGAPQSNAVTAAPGT